MVEVNTRVSTHHHLPLKEKRKRCYKMSYPIQIPALLINAKLILTVKMFTVSWTLITIASILQIKFLTKTQAKEYKIFTFYKTNRWRMGQEGKKVRREKELSLVTQVHNPRYLGCWRQDLHWVQGLYGLWVSGWDGSSVRFWRAGDVAVLKW